MRVLMVANYEPDGQQSMQRYTAWLARALGARGHEVTITRPRPFFSKLTRHRGLGKYLGYFDKFSLFPFQLRRLAGKHDLVHVIDHSNSMYLSAVGGKPNLITCHDVLAIRAARGEFAEAPTGWSGRLFQKWILSGLRTARRILCVSNKTAEDLKRLLDEPRGELTIVYTAVTWSFMPGPPLSDELMSRLGLSPGQPYFLHVGGNQWYKNRVGVLRIFARLLAMREFSNTALVMAGKPWTALMRNVIREEHIEGHVIDAGTISNEALQALYSNAQALLFPSLEEGFGLPIVEAQACGCPVITTGRPPMSEVAGNAAIFIDPSNASGAAATIARGLEDRESLRSAGFQNLARFEEEAIVERYCAAYESILADKAWTGEN